MLFNESNSIKWRARKPRRKNSKVTLLIIIIHAEANEFCQPLTKCQSIKKQTATQRFVIDRVCRSGRLIEQNISFALFAN
jgi:hypothetical protein